jgi:hypothetical protein
LRKKAFMVPLQKETYAKKQLRKQSFTLDEVI